MRERVEAAEIVQQQRLEGTALQTNADSAQPLYGMGSAEICNFCPIDKTGTNLLKAAMQQMQLSARAYHRILQIRHNLSFNMPV